MASDKQAHDLLSQPQAVGDDQTDGAAWLDIARERTALEDQDGAITAARRALDSVTGLDVAHAYGVIAISLSSREEWDGAAEAIVNRVAALRAEGHDAQAGSEERRGLAGYRHDGDADVRTLLDELALLESSGAPEDVIADVILATVASDFRLGNFEDTIERIARAQAAFVGDDRARSRETANMYLFQAQMMSGDLDGAAESAELACTAVNRAARASAFEILAFLQSLLGAPAAAARSAHEAVNLFVALEAVQQASDSAALSGRMYLQAGEPDEGLNQLKIAVEMAERGSGPDVSLFLDLGRALVMVGLPEEGLHALEDLNDTLSDLPDDEAAEMAPFRAEVTKWRGNAFEVLGDYSEALDAWQTSVELRDQINDDAGAAQLRASMATVLLDDGQEEAAAEMMENAIAGARKAKDDPMALFSVLTASAIDKSGEGNPTAVENIDEAIALARSIEADDRIADALSTKEYVLGQLSYFDPSDSEENN